MSLIICSECEKQISSEAKSCPNCGARGLRAKSNRKAVIVICVVAALGALIAVSVHSANQWEDRMCSTYGDHC
ncbi:MAG: zinc-ribbon domain-containing protein [Actinobacteria bacterium]|nr:zinc-ribbon domain-containing protein [Actinomycetota bacterium]